MADTPPTYLHVSNHLNESGKFNPKEFYDEELIYRRYSINKVQPKDEYFAEVKIDDKGVSVNRETYCKKPDDVMWSNEHEPVDKTIEACDYTKKNGMVIYSNYCVIQKTPPPPNYNVDLKKTWTTCNVSHCDIMFNPPTTNPNKKEKRALRIYLASLFKEDVEDVKCA